MTRTMQFFPAIRITSPLKANFDTALNTRGEAFSACRIRNEKSEVIGVWVEKVQTKEPFEAEAFAAKLSLKVAEERGEKHMFEGDALNVVRSLRGHSMSEELSARYLIVGGKEILAKHPYWKVDFAPSDCCKDDHNIAQWVKSCNWSGYIPPPLISPALLYDRGGTGDSCISVFYDLNDIFG